MSGPCVYASQNLPIYPVLGKDDWSRAEKSDDNAAPSLEDQQLPKPSKNDDGATVLAIGRRLKSRPWLGVG
jgi:hypothetical protein